MLKEFISVFITPILLLMVCIVGIGVIYTYEHDKSKKQHPKTTIHQYDYILECEWSEELPVYYIYDYKHHLIGTCGPMAIDSLITADNI